MSVVGFTFGTAAKAMRPSAANAASVPTSATMRASGRVRSYQAKPASRPSAEDREGCELPAHAGTSTPVERNSATPSAGSSAPPVPPRIRAVSVAK